MTVTVGWIDRAACTNESPSLFFGPENESDSAREMRERGAKSVCARCEVRPYCLERAIATHDRWSVSGGMTPDERTSHLKRQGRVKWGAANRARAIDLGEKRCTKCKQVKLLDQFAREGNGWRSNCKDCRNAGARSKRAEAMAS